VIGVPVKPGGGVGVNVVELNEKLPLADASA
jgi:hypothetical protein